MGASNFNWHSVWGVAARGALKTYFNNWSGLEKYFNEYTFGPLEEDIEKSECFSTFDRVQL